MSYKLRLVTNNGSVVEEPVSKYVQSDDKWGIANCLSTADFGDKVLSGITYGPSNEDVSDLFTPLGVKFRSTVYMPGTPEKSLRSLRDGLTKLGQSLETQRGIYYREMPFRATVRGNLDGDSINPFKKTVLDGYMAFRVGEDYLDARLHLSAENGRYIPCLGGAHSGRMVGDIDAARFEVGCDYARVGYFKHDFLSRLTTEVANRMLETPFEWTKDADAFNPVDVKFTFMPTKSKLYVADRFVDVPVLQLAEPKAEKETAMLDVDQTRIDAIREKIELLDVAVYGTSEKERLTIHVGHLVNVAENHAKMTEDERTRFYAVLDKLEERLSEMVAVQPEHDDFGISLRILEMEYDTGLSK